MDTQKIVKRYNNYALFQRYEIVHVDIFDSVFSLLTLKEKRSGEIQYCGATVVECNQDVEHFFSKPCTVQKVVQCFYYEVEHGVFDHFVLLDDFKMDDNFSMHGGVAFGRSNRVDGFWYSLVGVQKGDESSFKNFIHVLMFDGYLPMFNDQFMISFLVNYFDEIAFDVKDVLDNLDVLCGKDEGTYFEQYLGCLMDANQGYGYFEMAELKVKKIVQDICYFEEALALYDDAIRCGYLTGYYGYALCVFTFSKDKELLIKAFDYLLTGYGKGMMDCAYYLGVLYQAGIGVECNYKLSRSYLEMAVANGYPRAYAPLSLIYRNGLDTDVDFEQEKKYLVLGAKLNDVSCCLGLYHYYKRHTHIKHYGLRAIYWLKRGARLQCPECLYCLGIEYERGEFIKWDLKKALDLYHAGLQLLHQGCCYKLAYTFATRTDVFSKPIIAASLYEELIFSKNVDGYIGLADLYFKGHGVDKDLNKWESLLLDVGLLGKGQGFAILGKYYIDHDLKKGLDYLNQGILLQDGLCAYYLGKFYLGQERVDEAVKNFELSRKYGCYKGYKALVSMCHTFDEKEALFKECVERGIEEGYKGLGFLYLEQNTKVYDKEAFSCLLHSKYLGDTHGKYGLALCYAYGRGCRGDGDMAIQLLWYPTTKEACYLVGLIYEKGMFIKKFKRGSLKFYQMAYDLGYDVDRRYFKKRGKL